MILDAAGFTVSAMFGIRKATQLAEAAATIEVGVGTASTSEGALRELDPVAAAAFGISPEGGTVSRKVAMRVPSVRRGRNLIAGTIGSLALTATREDMNTGTVTPVARNSSTARLIRQLDPRTTPAYTLTWTVDDLLFYGVCWWRVTERDSTDYPVAVERIHRDRVQVQPATATSMARVLVDGKEVADRDLIRFDGVDEGLLTEDGAGPTVRLAIALQFAAKRQADDDWSGLVLRLAEGAKELTDDQITELLDAWDDARATRSTAFMNRAVNPEKISVAAAERQLTELAGHVATELARLMNLPASRTNAPQGSGMTYSNTESDRRDLVDTTLAPYLTAISQRLSMPDVTPNGTAVSFDLTAYLRGTTTELVNAGNAAVSGGLASRAEVRTRWLGLPSDPNVTDTPTSKDTPA